jgi:hypothetical protein
MKRIHRQSEAETSLARAISKTVSYTPDRSRTSDPRNFQFTDSITIASWDYVVMMKRAREAMNLN